MSVVNKICIPSSKMLTRLHRGITSFSGYSKKSLVVGVYTKKQSKDTEPVQTPENINGTKVFKDFDSKWNGKLTSLLKSVPQLKTGQAKTFYGCADEFSSVTVVGLGPREASINELECINEGKENIRKAIGTGLKELKECGVEKVLIDASCHPQAASEGAYLASWMYKESERQKFPDLIEPVNSNVTIDWNCGKVYADSQNWARHLMESPANLMTPTIFAESVAEVFDNCETSGKVEVYIRDKKWIEDENMGAFLSVAQGSDQPPVFVEIHYESPNNTADRPLVLVGKGVTFDSGGISIKPSQAMDQMRADMGGAATMVSAMLAAIKMETKGKVICLLPLCENLINGNATKPGDVITARNGVTIQVDNTDAEGRLLLADSLLYGQDFNPSAIINAATLTGAMAVALGSAATGVYSNNEELWQQLHKASVDTGDRFWRMPLFDHYVKQVSPSDLADLSNVGKDGRYGGSCTAAAFLRHFIKPDTKWAHLDIAGVMSTNGNELPYLCKGMAGRPTRTIAEFIRKFNY